MYIGTSFPLYTHIYVRMYHIIIGVVSTVLVYVLCLVKDVYKVLTNSYTLHDCDINSEWDIKGAVCLKYNLEKLSLRNRVECWFEKHTQFYISGIAKEKGY